MKNSLIFLILATLLASTPETLTVKVPGTLTVTPNPSPVFAEDYLERDVDGYALYSDLPTRYFRETATQTNNAAGKRVDTVFVTEIPVRNVVKFVAR